MNFDDNSDNKSLLDAQTGNEQQAAALSAIFPLPPMRYIKLYTDVNVRNKCTPPPPKPFAPNGQFLMFGTTIAIDDTIIRTLESQGLRRLYPRDYDHKRELKKINSSILVNFLDLLDVLIRCPDTAKREEKCNDLQMLFITMHHLINELRPHQARESIRVSLQIQKINRRDTTNRLTKQISRVHDLLKDAVDSISDLDLAAILQETNPENFPCLAAASGSENRRNNRNADNRSNTGMIGNSVERSQRTDDDKLNNQNEQIDHLKLSELDAFMCKLVDEIY